jgi:hypothetical protein
MHWINQLGKEETGGCQGPMLADTILNMITIATHSL